MAESKATLCPLLSHITFTEAKRAKTQRSFYVFSFCYLFFLGKRILQKYNEFFF